MPSDPPRRLVKLTLSELIHRNPDLADALRAFVETMPAPGTTTPEHDAACLRLDEVARRLKIGR
jgi:hypothetical protein